MFVKQLLIPRVQQHQGGGEMSLINEMLRNLEAKSPDDLLKQNLQREIRSLPPINSGNGHLYKVIAFVILLAIVTASVALHLRGQFLPLLGIETEPAVIVANSQPVLPPPPLETAHVPLVQPVVESATVDAEIRPISDRLLMARELAFVPQSTEILPPSETQSAHQEHVVAQANKDVVNAAESVSSVPEKSPMTTGPVKIEKKPVLATPEDRAEFEYRKAEIATSQSRGSEAIKLLSEALKIDPSHILARQALVRQLITMNQKKEAMRVLDEGLLLMPGQIAWAVSLARLQFDQGDLAAADRTLIHTQPFAESIAEYAGFQGHLKTQLGDNRQAAEYYLRASRLEPKEGRWWLGLGLAFEADGKMPEAKEAFRRSLATGNLPSDLAAVATQRLR